MQIRKTEEYEGQCACGARFRNLNVDMVIQEFQIHLDTEAHEHNALAAIEREEEGSF